MSCLPPTPVYITLPLFEMTTTYDVGNPGVLRTGNGRCNGEHAGDECDGTLCHTTSVPISIK
jgi:hypothetical protein